MSDSKNIPRRPALHGAPEFISWTWEMINGGYADIGWSNDGKELVVRNPERLTREVFPQFFRHTQYSSFVRALNAYQFRKTRPGQWTNPNFQRDRPDLLKNITRKVAKPKADALALDALAATSARWPAAALRPEDVTPEQLSTWELLVEERQRIEFLKAELAAMEAQVKQAQASEFQQRVDAVWLGQFVAQEVQAFAPAPLEPQLARLVSPFIERAVGSETPVSDALANLDPSTLNTLASMCGGHCPEPGKCELTEAVREKCGGCHATALELRKLCKSYCDTNQEHSRLCEELRPFLVEGANAQRAREDADASPTTLKADESPMSPPPVVAELSGLKLDEVAALTELSDSKLAELATSLDVGSLESGQ